MERHSSSKYDLQPLHPLHTLTVVFGGGAVGGGGNSQRPVHALLGALDISNYFNEDSYS